MATIGELIINVKAGTAAFAGDLTRVKNLSFDTSRQIERSFQIMGTAAVGMLAAFGAAMADMVDKTIEFEVHILHLSESAGVTTETMSALAFAAKLMGVDVDQVAKAMERFDKQLLLAQEGKGQSLDLMKRMGIDPAKIKTSDEALMRVAEHFAKMPDGVLKTGEAMTFFGRAGAAIIPIMKDLTDSPGGLQGFMDHAKALGLILDKETGEAALHFKENLSLLGLIFQGISMDVVKEVLPSLSGLTDSFVKGSEAIEKHRIYVEVLAGALRTAASAGVILLATVADLSNSFLTEFTEMRLWGDGMVALFHAVTAAAAGDFAAAKGFIREKNFAFRAETEAEAEGAAKSYKIQSDLMGQLKGIWSTGADQVSKTAKAFADLNDLQDKADAAARKLKSALDNITSSLKLQNATFHQSAVDIELYKLTVDGASYAQRQHVLSLYATNQGLKDQAAYLKIVADQAKAVTMADLVTQINDEAIAIEEFNRANQNMPDLLGTFQAVPTAIRPAVSAVQDLTDKLNEQIKTFGMSDAQLQIMDLEAVGATQQEIAGVIAKQNEYRTLQDIQEKTQQRAREAAQEMNRFQNTVARDFTDMIVAGKGFNQVLQDIFKSIVDILMKRAFFGAAGSGGGIFGMISGLVGGLFGGGGGGGGGIGSVLGGGVGDPIFLAGGGDVSAGQPVIVGENGPELFMPSTGGAIIPNGEGNGGGSGSVSITYNIDARGSSLTEEQIRRSMAESEDRAVRRAMAGTRELSLRTA